MGQLYKRTSKFTTVDVDKSLLVSIENYCINKIPGILNVSSEDITKAFTSSIKESNGENRLGFIQDYQYSQFSDSTIGISVGFTIRDYKNSLFTSVNINFAKNKIDSSITVEISEDSPREKVSGIITELVTIIDQKKNLNFIFHPGFLANFLIGFLGIMSFSISTSLFEYNLKYGVLSIILAVLCFLYFSLFKKMKPYCAFDTSAQRRNNIIANWLILALLAFVLITSPATWLRKWLFGF